MEGTEAKSRPSVVEKLIKGQPRHEPEVEEAMEVYEEARARSREALMLDVRFRDGKVVSFDYAHLAKAKFLSNGKFVLCFGTDEVIAEGKNLMKMYTSITEHRRRFIREETEAEEGLKPEDAAHIERIEIVEGDEDQ